MKNSITQKVRHFILFFFSTTVILAQSNNDIVREVQDLFEEHYIFLDVAKAVNVHLETLIKNDAFKDKSPTDFAKLLKEELLKLTKDKHIYFSLVLPKPSLENKATLLKQSLNRDGSMFRMAQLFESNIGYIDLSTFGGTKEHMAEIDAVMKVMEKADALIFDMRKNNGGSPYTVNYLISYFFNEKLILNTIYSRSLNYTQEFLVEAVNGVKRPKVPVYILTSDNTISAAEDFAYTMQSWDRAIIIGEITEGAAHPTRGYLIQEEFVIGIPFARTINPITKTNWEGVGVVPDIETTADHAIIKAKELAKVKVLQNWDSFFKPLENILVGMEDKTEYPTTNNRLHEQLDVLIKSNMMNESKINGLGYEYLNMSKPYIALAIFKSNTLLFPDSANTWDSLADAYLHTDNKEMAILNYNKAIKMDPDGIGESARDKLSEIQID